MTEYFRLVPEALEPLPIREVLVQELQGDLATRRFLLGRKDRPHSSLAKPMQEAVALDLGQ